MSVEALTIRLLVPSESEVLVFGAGEQHERLVGLLSQDSTIAVHATIGRAAVREKFGSPRFSTIVVDGPCYCLECSLTTIVLAAHHVTPGGSLIVTETNPAHADPRPVHWGDIARHPVRSRHALERLEWMDGMSPRWQVTLDQFDPTSTSGGLIVLTRRF